MEYKVIFLVNQVWQLIGHWASLIGGVLLIGVAIWLILFEGEDEEEEKLERLEVRLTTDAYLLVLLSRFNGFPREELSIRNHQSQERYDNKNNLMDMIISWW